MAGCVNRGKRITSNDRVLEWETTAKELSVGHSVDGAREALAREIMLGGHCTRDGGGDGSQGWDEGENPHDMWLSRKESGG